MPCPPLRARRALLGAALLLAVAVPAAPVAANTSHEGWPRIDGDLKMNKSDADAEMTGRPDRHNELLGGHGDDVIRGGRKGDVLWGDYKPGGQPTDQVDELYGGGGRDFIYASHGENRI